MNNIKRDRAIRRFKNSEVIATILTGIALIFVSSPILIYYTVSSKHSLDFASASDDSINASFLITTDEVGNVVDRADFDQKFQDSNLFITPTESEFSKGGTNFYNFCSNLENSVRTIVVFAFDYLLPFISYNCAKNDVVVYGIDVQSDQGFKPSLITKITWSFNSFF